MTQRKYFAFLATFFFVLIFIIYFLANFYFLSRLTFNNSSKIKFAGDISESENDETSVQLKSLYKSRNPKFDQIRNKIVHYFKPCNRTMMFRDLWNEVDSVSFENSKFSNKFYYYAIILLVVPGNIE
jgi:hypothetical protein